MPQIKPLLTLAALLLATANGRAGEVVSDKKLGFRFTVPGGFVPAPEQVRGDVLYAFHRPAADGRSVGTFLLISRLNGVLGREKLDPKDVAAKSPVVTLSTERWKSFDIEVFRVPEEIEDRRMVTFNAQVPLKPSAIQVGVIGEAAREAESSQILRSVLGTLDGETNWLTGSERIQRGTEGIIRLAVTIGVVVAIVMAFVYFARRMMRNNRPTGRHRYDDNDRPLE